MFVRGVVICDQMQFFVGRRDAADYAQEFQPLLMTVPVVAHADHGAIQSAQGRE
jgi:hypothetical protein